MTDDGTTTVVLEGPPSLARLYGDAAARALGTGVRSLVARVRGDHERSPAPVAALPQVRYRLDGVRADPARLDTYRALVAEPWATTLPAGYVHVLAFPVAMALLSRPEAGLPLAGTVHVANRVVQHRAVAADATLVVQAGLEHLRPHRRGVLVDVVVRVDDATGTLDDPAWEEVSTYLVTGASVGVPPQGAASGGHEERASGPHDDDPWLPTEVWHLGADEGRRYAAVSGDRNPIHLSAATARIFGFRRAIAHGMDTASRALASLARERGDAFTWSVDFGRPVLLPGTIQVRVVPDDGGSGLRVEARDPATGRAHLTSTLVRHPADEGAPGVEAENR